MQEKQNSLLLSVAKVRFGFAKQLKNLKRYLLYIKLGLYNCDHTNVDKEQTKFVSLLSCIAPAFRDKSAFAKKERGRR